MAIGAAEEVKCWCFLKFLDKPGKVVMVSLSLLRRVGDNPLPATGISLYEVTLLGQGGDGSPLLELNEDDIGGVAFPFSEQETVEAALVIWHLVFKSNEGVFYLTKFKQVSDSGKAVLPGYKFLRCRFFSQFDPEVGGHCISDCVLADIVYEMLRSTLVD